MDTILSITALVISVVSGAFALYTFIWTAQRDRKQATLDAYNRLQEQVFDRLSLWTRREIIIICEDKKSEKYKKLSAYIARIEHFCVGVNQGIYDRKTVYELSHGYLDGAIKDRIVPVIMRKNDFGKEHSKNSEEVDFFENIHKVYAWMEQETAKREHEKVKRLEFGKSQNETGGNIVTKQK